MKGVIVIKEAIGREHVKYKRKTDIIIDSSYIKRPIIKDKKLESRYYKLYKKAYNYYLQIVKEGNVSRYRTATDRATFVYEHPRFKDIIDIGNTIKVREIRSLIAFFSISVSLSAIAALMAVVFLSIIPSLCIPVFFLITGIILSPNVSYKKFYINVYMPIAYYAAGMHDRREELIFTIKQRRGSSAVSGKETVVSKFIIDTIESRTKVKRIVLTDTINHYRFEKGRLLIGKKKATVFSGYSFETQIKNLKNTRGNKLKYAIINTNTYFKIPGIPEEEEKKLVEETVNYPGLKHYEWMIYRNKDDGPMNKRQHINIQKKILAISRELGIFNIYIYDNYIKILYNINFNREGIDPKLFESSLSDDNSMTYSGFIAIVKVLCILGVNEMLIKTVFGQKALEQNHIVDKDKLNKRYYKGEAYIDVIIKITISVIIAGIIYSGIVNIYKDYIEKNGKENDNIAQAYEQSEPIIIDYDYLK